MHHHIGTTPYDTEHSCRIVDEINELERTQRQLNRMIDEKIRALTDTHTTEMIAQQPQYPTDEQRDIIAQIAKKVHDENDPRPIATRTITFDPRHGLINLYAQAPYFPTGTARLWEFSGQDIRRVRALLREHGLRVTDEWIRDDGHAFVVRSRKI